MNKEIELKKLNKEFRQLIKGKKINVKVSPKEFVTPIWVLWHQEDYADYSHVSHCFEIDFDKQVRKACAEALKPLNQEIKTFLNKCDATAKIFKENKEDFFNEMMMVHEKDNSKKALKKEIEQTKKKLVSLEKKLK